LVGKNNLGAKFSRVVIFETSNQSLGQSSFAEYFKIERISNAKLELMVKNMQQLLDRKELLLDFIRENDNPVSHKFNTVGYV